MGVFNSLAGTVQVEITSADVSGLLSALALRGVVIMDISMINELSMHGTIYRKDYGAIKAVAKQRGDKIIVRRKYGTYWKMKSLIRRPLFIAGILFLLAMVTYLPTRIFFVKVEGNRTIPTRMIQESAESCGICFGASRRAVRSEKMKNALLEKMPQLQWAGVNTVGCIAVISVEEKSISEVSKTQYSVSSIVALQDCVIDQCTVTSGNPLCHVGQAVKAGQTLVSGFTDCGLTIKATRSEAEIFGQTYRKIQAISIMPVVRRGEKTDTKKKYSVLIGKKVIKFFKDSGISDARCVKMYSKKYLTLPGGFQLPVALICEQFDTYSKAEELLSPGDWMGQACRTYLSGQMVAGEILREKLYIDQQEQTTLLTGYYCCREMIGHERFEGR